MSAQKQVPASLELTKVYDSTLLTSTAVYLINGSQYRFLCRDAFASVNSPQYIFEPLPGQRKKSTLTLNHKQLLSKVYEVPNFKVSPVKTTQPSVQTSLFD